jgi:hypothetical protein
MHRTKQEMGRSFGWGSEPTVSLAKEREAVDFCLAMSQGYSVQTDDCHKKEEDARRHQKWSDDVHTHGEYPGVFRKEAGN